MSKNPVPRTDLAISFLQQAFPGRAVHLVALLEGTPVEAASFEASNLGDAHEWIEARQGKKNIYFHVNQLRSSVWNRKANKSDVQQALWLHVDIDDPDALPAIRRFAPRPTVAINSGGGYQLFWRLDQPTPSLEAVEDRNRWLANSLGGDNCHNIDRVMRLPGTINVLSQKKIAAGRSPKTAEVLDELTDWTRTYPLDAFHGVKHVSRDVLPVATLIPSHVDLEDLPTAITDEVKTLIRRGNVPLNAGGRTKYPSRSEALFRVLCDLGRAGVPPEQMLSIILDPEYEISSSVREKSAPQRYANRQVQAALEAVAEGWPDATARGQPKSTYRNALVGLRRMGVVGEYDQFHQRKLLHGFAIQQYQGDLTDDLVAVLREAFIRSHRFDPGKINLIEATSFLCLENSYHPIQDYLVSLKWDGKKRLDSWLSTYLSADATELTMHIGRIVLVAAVRRIRQPGVKFDNILVLEGRQGTGKSTAIRILAGDANFSDQDILTLDARQQMEAMEGVWLYEISELSGLNRSEISKVKAFVSRQVDQARPAYARFRESRPRQTIFIGTTNEETYLRDTTGNRRFWPVSTGEILLEELRRDRDQLWAEAVTLEEAGFSAVLPKEFWADAEAEQLARLEEHPWLEALSEATGHVSAGKERISTEQLFSEYLGLSLENRAQFQLKQVVALMRQLGWSGPKKFNILGRTLRGYERETDEPDRPPKSRPKF